MAASLIGGGVFYAAWLVAFLSIYSINKDVLNTPLWLSAPVVTAAGFAAGVILVERLTRVERSNFWRVYICPLVGCTAGAVITHGFGPMPSVFAIFVAGMVSIMVREAILIQADVRTHPLI